MSPETDAVSTMDPDFRGRITATAARMQQRGELSPRRRKSGESRVQSRLTDVTQDEVRGRLAGDWRDMAAPRVPSAPMITTTRRASVGSFIAPAQLVPVVTVPGMMPAPADLLEMHQRMLLIRGFEERVSRL